MLHIEEITIQDTYATAALTFPMGSVTHIVGENGSGKTSILRALLYIFEGGIDPNVIRRYRCQSAAHWQAPALFANDWIDSPDCTVCGGKGEIQCEASIVQFRLTNQVTIKKTTYRVKPARGAPEGPPRYNATLEITNSDGTPMNIAPKSYIEELSKAMAVNPTKLLRIDATTVPGRRELVAELMRLVPILFSPEEVDRACSYRSSAAVIDPDTIALDVSPEGDVTLDALKKYTTQIEERRRRIGQTRDDTEGTINRLSATLGPADQVDNVPAVLAEAEDYLAMVKDGIAKRAGEIERETTAAINEITQAALKAEAAIDREINEKIRALEAERTRRIIASREKKQADIATVHTMEAAERKSLEAESAPVLQKAVEEVQKWRGESDRNQRSIVMRREIDLHRSALTDAAWTYAQLTGVLTRMEFIRTAKLKSLPVSGLTVEDGQAYLDGISWPNVNLGRRVQAVLQICTQIGGKLPLLIMDECECLDNTTREAYEQGLVAAGYQFLVAIVRDGPLRIERVDREVGV